MRGGGQEQLATGVNPASYNRERFEVRARPRHQGVVGSPARSAGRARISIASSIRGRCRCKSRTAVADPRRHLEGDDHLAAKQRHPDIALNTSIEQTKKIWN